MILRVLQFDPGLSRREGRCLSEAECRPTERLPLGRSRNRKSHLSDIDATEEGSLV